MEIRQGAGGISLARVVGEPPPGGVPLGESSAFRVRSRSPFARVMMLPPVQSAAPPRAVIVEPDDGAGAQEAAYSRAMEPFTADGLRRAGPSSRPLQHPRADGLSRRHTSRGFLAHRTRTG